MKVTVRTEDGSWLQDVHIGCRPEHRHYATRVGTRIILNCEVRGPLERWDGVPPGGGNIVVDVNVPRTSRCTRCGKLLAAGPRGTVHKSSGKRQCYGAGG